jgi:hypothetical protein
VLLHAANRVLAVVRLLADPVTGLISDRIFNVGMVAQLAGLELDKVTALLDVLITIGSIERRADDRLVVTGIVPELAVA